VNFSQILSQFDVLFVLAIKNQLMSNL